MRQSYCVQMLVKKADGINYPFGLKADKLLEYQIGWTLAVGGIKSYKQAMEVKKNLSRFFPAETFAVEVE